MFQTTWLFFDILLRKVFFFQRELGGSATPGFIIETRNTMMFPFLDPCSHCVSINLIYLRDFFDLHPLCAEQNPVRTDPGSGGRIMVHDFCQRMTLAFGQRTHIPHDHHSRGQCYRSANISYDVPCMGAISYQKTFASALTRARTLDAYARVDLAVNWTLTRHCQVFVAVDNLFDAAYEEFIGFPAPGVSPHAGIRTSF